MSKFTEASFEKKLKDLNATQQSIQTLSLWVLHHKKHYKLVVQIWHREIYKSSNKKKIILLYLANDIIQNGRKKAPEYIKEFKIVLPIAYPALIKDQNNSDVNKLKKVIQVWEDRNIFEKEFLKDISGLMENIDCQPKKVKFSSSPILIKPDKSDDGHDDFDYVLNELDAFDIPYKVLPEPGEMIELLTKLENCASSDAATREDISKLPSYITDINYIDNIHDKEELLRYETEVDSALNLLNSYNDKLTKELEDRKKASFLLTFLMQHQSKIIQETDEKIKIYRDKLRKLNTTRLELQLHLDKLPDISYPPPGLMTFTSEDIFTSIIEDEIEGTTGLIESKLDHISPFGRKLKENAVSNRTPTKTDKSIFNDYLKDTENNINPILPTNFFVSPTITENTDEDS